MEKNMDLKKFQWTRQPKSCQITDDRIEVVTNPHTDLWQIRGIPTGPLRLLMRI